MQSNFTHQYLRQKDIDPQWMSVKLHAFHGAIAKWLGTGLQNLLHRFDSGSRLHLDHQSCLRVSAWIMPVLCERDSLLCPQMA